MKKIGILGGTFNPVHIGHLVVAQTALEELGLDCIYFVPCYLPPLKSTKNLVGAKKRTEMVRQAIDGNKSFKISDFEIQNRGKSYTIDTVKFFHDKFPKKTKFFFIIGEDACSGLDKWKDIDDLKKLVSFVALTRPSKIKSKCYLKVKNITMPGIDVSSSQIRSYVRRGKSVKYLVPLKVDEYIKKHKLYT